MFREIGLIWRIPAKAQLSRLNLLIIDELGLRAPVHEPGRNCSSRSSASATNGDPQW